VEYKLWKILTSKTAPSIAFLVHKSVVTNHLKCHVY
jgi:hypothetical protein